MMEFIESLNLAFNGSANYLTWSFFSFVASFAIYQAKQKDIKKTKQINIWVKGIYNLCTLLFLVIGAVNVLYIVNIFGNEIGSWVTPFVGLFALLVALNAGIVVWGKVDDNKNK
ncbi:hypothetical protein [Xenorhabdus sp. KJ12.1]|uniref:hypothetical protein n=1 Tax=Xenorhabdus sp. KJ12.1 TaxID=1851571 RepID=UPI000C041D5D|nr:hypothetical protein [Xenorhabdus sp. KJ12.1]PHM69317.1 hypothetical protein Xekj_02566 [Xenorhabdus sp. KJ12.1]